MTGRNQPHPGQRFLTREYPLSNLLVGRRRFLITSALGATGLLLFPLEEVYASPIFGAVAKLAGAFGAEVLSGLINNYLRQRDVPTSLAQEIRRTNQEMAQNGGFSDLSESPVYRPESDYIFYPARKASDGFNTCAAFLDGSRNSGSQQIALIEGPTLFGVGELAAKVSENRSSNTVRRTFLPRENISSGGVSMRRSYNRPDEFRTNAGTVRAHYTTNGRGRGTVTVEARNERGSLLAGGDYDLNYHTAE